MFGIASEFESEVAFKVNAGGKEGEVRKSVAQKWVSAAAAERRYRERHGADS